jgi:glycosyltransferase involved in cell wall biosynthesis
VGFPPMGESGVLRTAKFVKYLPCHGWKAAVLTGDPEHDGLNLLDRSLLAEVPQETEVLRVPYWNPGRRLTGILSRRRAGGQGAAGALVSPTESPEAGSVGIVRRALRNVRTWLHAPVGDIYFYWARRARRPALDLARRSGARVIYVSVSPYTSGLLGLWLKRRTGLPLVVDFRDPWTLFAPETAHGLRFRMNRHYERAVLRGADAVICNHRPMLEDFERIEPRCRGRCEVITNGYDPEDFRDSPPPVSNAEMLHVGYAWGRSPQPVLRALAALRERGAVPPKFRLRFLGGLPASSLGLVGQLELSDLVVVEPRVEHADAVRAMRSAGRLLLLLVGGRAGARWYPSKVFEYLAAGRPVICVSPEGIAADLVRESGLGRVLVPQDSEALQAELAVSPAEAGASGGRPEDGFLSRFDRRELTARLAAVFDRLAGGRG